MARRKNEPSRRTFLLAGAATVVGVEAGIGRASGPAPDTGKLSPKLASLKAIVFDTFGTVVDWRTSVIREVTSLARRKGLVVDGAKFAEAWRGGYGPSMDRVRTGELPWTKLDRLHRMTLDRLVADFRLTGLSEPELARLNRVWHRLRPWPDAVAGLTRLKRRFVIAPLSNGNISLMTEMAKHGGLPWDCILGAELVRHYKPDREVYRSAAEFLDLEPGEVMMVAAHSDDLRAAGEVGLRTAFVPRLLEYGRNGGADRKANLPVDLSAADFNDLARQLGA